MNQLTGGNQPAPLDIREANALLQDKVKAQENEINELKAQNEYLTAALDQMLGQFEERHVWVPTDNKPYLHFEWEGYGIDGHYCADAPELTRYLCERNGWPNPLEGGEK
ncbi:hypothetical protein [Microcystis phage Mvi-JY20]|uniref:Uncharacterized protein n=1 Tax=Microcystis phage Mvi-JY20 TaxID=3128146 RepID=A0AAX4QH81_9CAUD